MRCKVVARHDVEADAGQEHDSSRLGVGVARREGLENLNFSCDVEVVNAIAETGVRHRPRRRRERSGDIEHHRGAFDRRIKAGGVAKVESLCGEAKRFADRFDSVEVAPGQNRARALIGRHLRNQLPGVTGRPVEQDGSFQEARLRVSRRSYDANHVFGRQQWSNLSARL